MSEDVNSILGIPPVEGRANDIFCRNCGKKVNAVAIACPGCGVPPRTQKNFCHHCGKPTSAIQIMCTQCGVSLAPIKEKSRLTAGILAILLGHFGVHKFYLGNTGWGVFMLCASLLGVVTFGISTLAIWITAFIEGIIYLTKSDEEFAETYIRNKRTFF